MAEGLYRIGECIFMEVYPPPMPYQICKIEELRKNSKGSVEVAAKCFYRRKDLPTNLLVAADRHAMAVEEENEIDPSTASCNNFDKLSELQRHLVHHRELFLSRQIETYKIDMVRGKCTVSLLNELEDISAYLEREDTFFYTMVYDPNQKTLLVDKGEIRTGPDYQAEIPPYIAPEDREDRVHPAVQMWQPNRMPDHKVEQFLVVARSIGTFARALLDGAKKPQISLRLGAAAASRDITLFHAMDTLHQNEYDITQATSCLVPRGPVLCADELEAWTQEEAKRFEDGLQEQKDFLYIQKKYLPWKPVKSIVAYYYMWKTTDRYQIQKRHRMIEKQNDLKEVIVHLRTPTGTAPGPRDLSGKAATAGTIPMAIPENMAEVPSATDGEKGCESCFTTSAARWYQWGPAHEHCRLCNLCYTYWRKYGGLKLPTRWESIERRIPMSTANIQIKRIKPMEKPSGQTRIGKRQGSRRDRIARDIVPPLPFFMKPNGLSRYIRHKLGTQAILKAARCPFVPVDVKENHKVSGTPSSSSSPSSSVTGEMDRGSFFLEEFGEANGSDEESSEDEQTFANSAAASLLPSNSGSLLSWIPERLPEVYEPFKLNLHEVTQCATANRSANVLLTAETLGIANTSRIYGIPEATLRDWKKQGLHPKHSAAGLGGGRKVTYGEDIEKKIVQWVLEKKAAQVPLSMNSIQTYAQDLVRREKPEVRFSASRGWLEKFLHRNALNLQFSPKQTPPTRKVSYGEDLEKKIVEWVKSQRSQHPVSMTAVQAYAQELVRRERPGLQFSASRGWLEKFLHRNSLSLRQSKAPKMQVGLEAPTHDGGTL